MIFIKRHKNFSKKLVWELNKKKTPNFEFILLDITKFLENIDLYNQI